MDSFHFFVHMAESEILSGITISFQMSYFGASIMPGLMHFCFLFGPIETNSCHYQKLHLLVSHLFNREKGVVSAYLKPIFFIILFHIDSATEIQPKSYLAQPYFSSFS